MTPLQPTVRVVRGTIAYGAAAVIQRAVGFLLLPLYARVLDPAEYGRVAVLMTLTSFVGTLLGLGLESSVFRNYIRLQNKPAELSRFVTTVGSFAVIFPALSAAFLAFALSTVLAGTFDVPRGAVVLALVGGAFWTSATIVPLAVLRAQERLRAYIRLSGLQTALTVGLTLTFVVGLGWGAVGWMLAFSLSAGLTLAVGLTMLGHGWALRLHGGDLWAALAFGLPMLPHALAHWGLSLSDRAILGAFVDSADVGAYYVAFQFCLPISLIAIALNQASQPLYAEASLADGIDPALGRTATHHIVGTTLLTMAVALLGPPAVLTVLPGSYAQAAQYIPWIALGQGLFGLYFVPMNAITMLSGRNRWVWIVTVAAAVANIGLNLILVPAFGAFAAAVNTAVGYAILLAGVSLFMVHVLDRPIRYEWSRIGLGMLVVVAGAGPALVLSSSDPLVDLMIRGAVLAVVSGLLVAVGLFRLPVFLLKSLGRAP
jgi:O-antigen/teichoic acid export membrane protein